MFGTGDSNLNPRLQRGQSDRGIGQQPTQIGPGDRMPNRNRAARLAAAYQETARQETARLQQELSQQHEASREATTSRNTTIDHSSLYPPKESEKVSLPKRAETRHIWAISPLLSEESTWARSPDTNSGSGLGWEDDHESHRRTIHDQSSNSREFPNLSNHPQQTYYPNLYSEEQSSSEPSSGFDPETITSLNTSWYDKLLSSPRPLNPEASAFTPSTPFGKEEKTTDKEVEETVTKLKRDKEDFIKKGFGSIVNLPEPYLQEILSKVENEKTGDINAFLGRIQSISRRSGFVAQIKSTGETTERISTELSQIKETIEYSIEKYINQGNFNQFMKEIKPISKNLKRVGDYHLQYLRVNLLPIAKIAAAAEHHLDKSNAD